MDWIRILNAHVMWKQRLLAYINGDSDEQLNPEIIAKDDQCVLGKWIYGDGQGFCKLKEYEDVRQQHALFHKVAAEVVRLAQAGDQAHANELLHGEYSKVSERLKHRILYLSMAVQSN